MPRGRHGLAFRAGLASVLLGTLVVGGFGLMTYAVQRLRSASEAEVRAAQVLVIANELERKAVDLQNGVRGYVITLQPRFLQPYRAALSAYPGLVRQLRVLASNGPGIQAQITQIEAGIRDYVRDWAQPRIHEAATGRAAAARRLIASGAGKARIDAIRAQFAAFVRAHTRAAATVDRAADRVGVFAFGLGIVAMVVSALAVLIAAAVPHRAVVVPLRRLAGGMARLSAGDLTARVPNSGAAEIGELARGFNVMAGNVERDRNVLETQQAELETQQIELEEALTSVEQQRSRAEQLQCFGERLAAAGGTEPVGAVTLQELADTAHAEMGAIYLFDDRAGAFLPAASRGLDGAPQGGSISPGEGLAGRAIAERRPVEAAYGHTTLRLAGLAGSRSAGREMHLPLLHGGRVIGVVSLGRSGEDAFTPRDLGMLENLAGLAAVACAEALSVRQVEFTVHELEVLLASTDEGIYVIDREGDVTLVNRAALDQTGYTRAELLGHKSHDLLHHTRADGTPYRTGDCPAIQVLRTGIGRRVADDVFWHRDGTSFPVEYSAYPVFDGDLVTGVVTAFVDISARKRAERQRDTLHMVTRIIAESAGASPVWDQGMSAACTGLRLPIGLGWVPDDAGSRLSCVVCHAAPAFAEAAARLGRDELAAGEGPGGLALARREPVLSRNLVQEPPRPGVAADPRLRSVIAIPVIGATGTVLAVGEFFAERDLAEEGLAETLTTIAGQTALYIERVRAGSEIQLAKDEFVGTVSHELRTPLSSIEGWLQILLGGEPGPLTGEQRHFLGIIQRNSDRLLRQVGDLLLAGQIESGTLSLELADVDVAQLARDAAELVFAQADAKRVMVTLDAGRPAVVRGDRDRLIQLLDNLLTNAVKYTPEGGRVRLSVTRADGTCRVTVSDTGIGIPAEDRPHLFQRFFRASSATAQGIAGTGLGLVICRAIAEGHHGRVYLAEQEGPGSVFAVELPLAD